MSTPIPFESLHFAEAVLMQYIFASGWGIREDSQGKLYVIQPVKLHKRHLTKYKHVIARIRTLPDVCLA